MPDSRHRREAARGSSVGVQQAAGGLAGEGRTTVAKSCSNNAEPARCEPVMAERTVQRQALSRPVGTCFASKRSDSDAVKARGTAIRSLEGAKASPKPAAERYAPPRTCQGSLRDPYGQTLDRISPAQIPAAIGLGEGWLGDRTTSGCGHIGGADPPGLRTPRSHSRPRRRSRISRSSCRVHAIELSRFEQIKLTAATAPRGAPSAHCRSC
jgi:hypothetical protein